MNYKEKARQLISEMTLEEKASLCSGASFWKTKKIDRLNIDDIMVADGPHGLRKQGKNEDHLGLGESIHATCFPTASAIACSFDTELIKKVGNALGEECLKEKVAVLLGPGANMKRSPLCGRNFEYFSEDPYSAGKLAAAWIKGVQALGIGTSLKHFAANNQEKLRMTISAVVNERTLRDIYLRAFEIAVKEAKPKTVMCSYNKINDVYSSDNKRLLKDILRDEWGYEGMVVSDWTAVHDRILGIKAGLDLEMPGNGGLNDRKIIAEAKASDDDEFEKLIDKCAENVLALVLEQNDVLKKDFDFDKEKHHALSVEAAEKSIVLLKNDEKILPIDNSKKIAIIGEFAKSPRYQGAGSSKINPFKVENAFDCLSEEGFSMDFARGYSINSSAGQNMEEVNKLVKEACECAKDKDAVIVFVGLTEGFESEGFDRKDMKLPEDQLKLLDELFKINENIIVVLSGGAPVEIPFFDKAKALLLSYLGGEGVGKAVSNILCGKVNPSGRLAETWPLKLEDNPSYGNFPGNSKEVFYKEGIFIGYRHYDTKNVPVRFPFGYGLSYGETSFKDLKCDNEIYSYTNDKSGDEAFEASINISFSVKNESDRAISETAFVFVGHESEFVSLPKKELRSFLKIHLEAGEEKVISASIPISELGYYNAEIKQRYVENGLYKIYLCKNVNECVLENDIEIRLKEGELNAYTPSRTADDYDEFFSNKKYSELAVFKRPFTMENCFNDVRSTFMGRMVYKQVMKRVAGEGVDKEQAKMIAAMMNEMPFYALSQAASAQVGEGTIEGMLDIINLKIFKGLKKIRK